MKRPLTMKRIRQRLSALLVVILLPGLAWAQSVTQGGAFTGGHVPVYSSPALSQPIVIDGGGAAGGGIGVGIAELGLTKRGTGAGPFANGGSGIYNSSLCLFDNPTTTGNYHYLCFDPNAQGGGLLAYGAAGTAPVEALKLIVNGVSYNFPGSSVPFGTGGGTANAITSTLGITTLNTGDSVIIQAAAANTIVNPTLTLTLNGGGTASGTITKFGGTALVANDIYAAGHRLYLVYTGSGFELLNPRTAP